MTTEINNLASQSLNKAGLRQLNVPSGANATASPSTSEINADNVIRVNFDNRQEIASIKQTQKQPENQQLSEKQKAAISDSVTTLSRSVQSIARSLEFRVDENSGKTVITVRDSDSKEVIRQIPSDQALELSTRLKELQDIRSADPGADIAGILFTGKI